MKYYRRDGTVHDKEEVTIVKWMCTKDCEGCKEDSTRLVEAMNDLTKIDNQEEEN